jgi:MATE family multidrug resistance protein
LFIAVSFAGAWFFRLTGQPENLVAKAAAVSLVFALGLPGMLLFVTCNMFLKQRPPQDSDDRAYRRGADRRATEWHIRPGLGRLVEPMGAVGAVATSSIMRAAAFMATFAICCAGRRGRRSTRRGKVRIRDLAGQPRSTRACGGSRPYRLGAGRRKRRLLGLVFLGGAISTQALAAHQAALASCH